MEESTGIDIGVGVGVGVDNGIEGGSFVISRCFGLVNANA
jgi:hypothetical protein